MESVPAMNRFLKLPLIFMGFQEGSVIKKYGGFQQMSPECSIPCSIVKTWSKRAVVIHSIIGILPAKGYTDPFFMD